MRLSVVFYSPERAVLQARPEVWLQLAAELGQGPRRDTRLAALLRRRVAVGRVERLDCTSGEADELLKRSRHGR